MSAASQESESAATPSVATVEGLFVITNKQSNEVICKLVVSNQLFPDVKFLRPQDVVYSTHPKSLCQRMATWCNKAHEGDEQVKEWWPRAAASVLKNVSFQRGSRMIAMKTRFMRKYNTKQ